MEIWLGKLVFPAIACFSLLISICSANSYCTENHDDGGKQKPLLDYSYSTQIIGRWLEDKSISNMYEEFDKEKNMYSFRELSHGLDLRQIVNMTSSRTISIISGSCHVHDSWRSVGSLQTGGNVLEFLYAPNAVWKYKAGSKKIRGVTVQEWTACTGLGKFRNFTAHYYFTKDNIPFRLELKGVKKNQAGHVSNFHTFFDYFLFNKGAPSPDVFEIPPGYVCENITQVKTPQIVMSASFRMEVVEPPKKQVVLERIYFDKQKNLSLEEDWNTVRIHDYSRGIQFVIDRESQECTRTAITRFINEDQTVDRKGNIHMASLRHFLFDDGMFTYSGIRKARGISCDVYTKQSQAAEDMGASIVEIFIARPSVKMTNNEGSVTDSLQQPVRVLLKGGQSHNLVVKKKYDIYDFDPQENPEFNPFNLDPCYKGTGRRVDFKMFFVGDALSSWQWTGEFMEIVAQKISNDVGINILRVNIRDVIPSFTETEVRGSLFEGEQIPERFHVTTSFKISKKLRSTDYFRYSNESNTPTICAEYCLFPGKRPFRSFRFCTSYEFNRANKDCTFIFLYEYNYKTKKENLTYSDHIDFYTRNSVYYVSGPYLRKAWSTLKYVVNQGLVNVTDSRGNVFNAVYVMERSKSKDPNEITDDNPLRQFKKVEGIVPSTAVEPLSKITPSACARFCLNSLKYECEAFKYVYTEQKCYLYDSAFVQEDYGTKSRQAGTYIRTYSSSFEEIAGRAMLSPQTDTIYTDVKDMNGCAELCMKEKEFFCQSFEMCDGVCLLGRNHVYNAQPGKVREAFNCSLFSRDYAQDYSMSYAKSILSGPNVIEIGNVGAKKCATLCSTSPSYDCNMFEFCDSDSLCRLTTKYMKITTSSRLSSKCDLYTRKDDRQRFINSYSSSKQTSSSNSDGNHSPGSMGGIAIGMLVLGVVLMAVVAMAIVKLRSRHGENSGISIGFSKQKLESDS